MRWSGSASTCGTSHRPRPGRRSASRSWPAGGGASCRTGRHPPRCSAGICSPTVPCPRARRPPANRTCTATTRPSPRPPSAAPVPGPTPAPGTTANSKPGRTCSPTAPARWPRRWRSPARSGPSCTSPPPWPTPTSSPGCATSTPRAAPPTSPTASSASPRTHGPPPLRRTTLPSRCWSTCGRPRTGSRPGTGSGSRSPAAPIPGSPVTPAPGSRWPPRPPCGSPSRPCTIAGPALGGPAARGHGGLSTCRTGRLAPSLVALVAGRRYSSPWGQRATCWSPLSGANPT